MKVTVVILVTLDLDDIAAGDPQTEAVRDVVRTVAQTARHRIAAAGVRVRDVSAALTALEPEGPR